MDDRILEAIRGGAAVITAGRRLARHLRDEYDSIQQSAGLLAWPAPEIVSWAGWLDSLWEQILFQYPEAPVRLGVWQERVLWESVIDQTGDAAQLLQQRATALAAREAWQLATAWRLNVENIGAAGGDDARAFTGWARAFREHCSEWRWLEDASLADSLRERVDALRLPKRLVLAGFDEITPQQQDLLCACECAGCAIERVNSTTEASANVVRVGFPDARVELAAAARWCHNLLQSNEAARIAVVVPNLERRRDEVERIFRGILEPGFELPDGRPLSPFLNISAGRPLSAYPLIHAALLILGLDPDRTPWEDTGALLLSPFLTRAEAERSLRAQVDARLREIGDPQVPLTRVADLARAKGCPGFARSVRHWLTIITAAPKEQQPGGWSRTFAQLLSAFGWPGERALNSIEYQTFEAWNELLSNLAAADVTSAKLSRADAFGLLRSMAAERVFQPETGNAPVQILGLMEASGLTFDHAWVVGLHDEAWPEAPKPNPFLPVALQREASVPRCSPERELDFAQRATTRLMASAPDVVLSYPTRIDDRDVAPSPLILRARRIETEQLNCADGETYPQLIRASRATERFVDEAAPPVVDGVPQRGGTRVFQYQSQCPFRAFVELRLRTDELKIPAPGLDPRSRGTLAHLALEEVWRNLRTHERLCTHPNLAAVIRESVARALERWITERGNPLPERFARLEQQRLERLLAEWLEYEKHREPFEVMPPEEEQYVEVSGIHAKGQDRPHRSACGRTRNHHRLQNRPP